MEMFNRKEDYLFEGIDQSSISPLTDCLDKGWRVGLAGDADMDIKDALGTARVALVLGAEGPGLRPNTREHCDALARLPIEDAIESLNVSNAAAVALYAASIA